MGRMRKSTIVMAATAIVAAAVLPGTAARAELRWVPCGTVSCTTIQVPLDWTHAGGAQIAIGVARHEATDPDRRLGTLVFATGMNGSPLDTLATRYPYFPAVLRERFDLVAVGPRGFPHTELTGTTVLDCGPVPTGFVSPFPTTWAAYGALTDHNRGLYAACRTHSGKLVDHLDVDSQARDWEAVRVALGAVKISVLTFLHASGVAQQYAQRFPGRVRAMALDGPVNRATPFPLAYPIGAAAGEEAVGRFAAWCDTHPPVPSPPDPNTPPTSGCALHGQDARAAYHQIIQQAPVTAPGIDHTLYQDEVAQLLSYFLINGNHPGGGWLDLAATLYAAQHGNMLGLSIMYRASNGSPSATYAKAATCMSQSPPAGGYTALRSAVAHSRAIAPSTLGESGPWDRAAGCTGWPVTHLPPVRTADGTPPVLVITTRHNLYAPQPLAAAMARQFTQASVVDVDDDGHLAYLQSPCIQRLVNDYLVDVRLIEGGGAICSQART